MLALYLDGDFKICKNISYFNNSTQCVCLLAAYLQKLDIAVIVVQNNVSVQEHSFTLDDQPLSGFKLPIQCFNNVVLKDHRYVCKTVTNCCFPVIFSDAEQFVVSGLCHVLRFLVKEGSENATKNFVQLLGHKKSCLKATSEVSSRTHLCEVIGPNVIDNWNQCEKKTELIPQALVEFEKLLNEPVSIHNKDKRQRTVLRQLTEATMTSDFSDFSEPVEKVAKLYRTNLNAKLAVQTNDLPALEHVFADGVEMTLSDLALIPLVHFFINISMQNKTNFQAQLPSTMLWYRRVSAIPTVFHAAKLTSVTFFNVTDFGSATESETNFSKIGGEVLKLSGGENSKAEKNKK